MTRPHPGTRNGRGSGAVVAVSPHRFAAEPRANLPRAATEREGARRRRRPRRARGRAGQVVEARRRERFVRSLSNERLRRKLGHRLCHHDDFVRRYVVTIENHSGHAFSREVYETLTARGAPRTCFVFAPSHALDGAQADLEQALEDLIPYGPALISCIPGKLALYVSEYANPVWLLERR